MKIGGAAESQVRIGLKALPRMLHFPDASSGLFSVSREARGNCRFTLFSVAEGVCLVKWGIVRLTSPVSSCF